MSSLLLLRFPDAMHFYHNEDRTIRQSFLYKKVFFLTHILLPLSTNHLIILPSYHLLTLLLICIIIYNTYNTFINYHIG